MHVACVARETASRCQCHCIPGTGPTHPLQLCTASHTCRYGLPPRWGGGLGSMVSDGPDPCMCLRRARRKRRWRGPAQDSGGQACHTVGAPTPSAHPVPTGPLHPLQPPPLPLCLKGDGDGELDKQDKGYAVCAQGGRRCRNQRQSSPGDHRCPAAPQSCQAGPAGTIALPSRRWAGPGDATYCAFSRQSFLAWPC